MSVSNQLMIEWKSGKETKIMWWDLISIWWRESVWSRIDLVVDWQFLSHLVFDTIVKVTRIILWDQLVFMYIHCTYLNVCMRATRSVYCTWIWLVIFEHINTWRKVIQSNSLFQLNWIYIWSMFSVFEAFFVDFSLNWIQNTVDSPFNYIEGCLFRFHWINKSIFRKIASI